MENTKTDTGTQEFLQLSESIYRQSRKLQDRLLAEMEQLENTDTKKAKILKRRFGELITKSNEPSQRDEFEYQILKDLDFWDAALWQRQVFSEVSHYHYHYEHGIFHNAYQLATYILYSEYLKNHSIVDNWQNPSIVDNWLFRGQSERWPIVPTIFRSKNPLKKELENLFAVATAIMQEMGCSYSEAVAIAQHYRGNNDVNTWLIDVTTDPFVALFFASQNPKPGAQGLIWRIRTEEWEKLSGGNEVMGKINLIQPKHIHRIEVQKGLFLEAPNPLLFEQYVAFEWKFNHHAGVAFLDEGMGIVRENILHDDTKIRQIIKDAITKNEFYLPSNISFSYRLQENDYLDLMHGWLKEKAINLLPEWDIYLKTRAYVQEKLVEYYKALANDSTEKEKLLTAISLHKLNIFCNCLANKDFPENKFSLCEWANDAAISQIVLNIIADEKEDEKVALIKQTIANLHSTA